MINITPIINNESSRNKLVVFIEKLIAIICTILLWYFLLRHLFATLLLGNYTKTIEHFEFLLLVSLIIFLIILFWQQYNIRVFGSKDRRRARDATTNKDLAERFNISIENIKLLRSCKYLNVEKIDGVSYYSNNTLAGDIAAKLDTEQQSFQGKPSRN